MHRDNLKSSHMHLFQRENGFWYICFRRGVWKSLKTKDEQKARSIYNAAEKEYLKGRIAILDTKRKTSLNDFFAQYDAWCQENHKPSTYARERRIFPKFIQFAGPRTALHAVTQRTCERYIAYLKQSGNSPVTVNVELRTLRAAFNKAIEWNTTGTDRGSYIEKSPFRYIRPLKYHKERPRFIEDTGQIDHLFNVIGSEGMEKTKRIYRLVFAFYIFTGGRRSEIWRLSWKDITKTHVVFRERKNYEMLQVPIVPRLKAILGEWERGVGRLIPVSLDQMSKRMKHYLRKAGLGHLKPHDLRHTFASHLLMGGVDMRTVQRLLGHSSSAATEIYAHLTEEHKTREIQKLTYGN